jgi:PAS domain S-box-containing protein
MHAAPGRSADALLPGLTLLDRAADAVLLHDLGGRILFWSAGAERLFGWSSPEAVGHELRELLPSGEGPPIHANHELFETGEWRGEMRLATRGGERLAVESRETLLHDPHGEPRAVLVVVRDLTEKKELEAQLLRAGRLEVLGKLAAGVAHDLNNMLTPIRMGVELLQLDPDAEARPGLLATIRTSVEHGVALLQQLLTFARGSDGERHEPLRLETVLARVYQMLRHTLPRSVAVECEVAPNLWTVRGDATQLVQLIVNLCVNARDAMPQGGTLSLAAGNVLLRKEGEQITGLRAALLAGGEVRPGPHVVVAVRDTGTGMGREKLGRIFEPFYSTKAPGRGTGLGLPTVASIARGHGGFLAVETEPGRGSTFALYLPVTDSVAHEAGVEATALPPGKGELVLLVDDEESIRDVVRTTLEGFGYQVLCAAGGAEALDLFGRHHQISIVLVDLMMPGMDGLSLIRTLFRRDSGVRIIAASGTLPHGLGEEGPGTACGGR